MPYSITVVQGATGAPSGTPGDPGDKGGFLRFWTGNTTYNTGDIVCHGQVTYLCLQTHVSTTSLLSDAQNWRSMTKGAVLVVQGNSFVVGSVVRRAGAAWSAASNASKDSCATHVVVASSSGAFLAATSGCFKVAHTYPNGDYYCGPSAGLPVSYRPSTSFVKPVFKAVPGHLLVRAHMPALASSPSVDCDGYVQLGTGILSEGASLTVPVGSGYRVARGSVFLRAAEGNLGQETRVLMRYNGDSSASYVSTFMVCKRGDPGVFKDFSTAVINNTADTGIRLASANRGSVYGRTVYSNYYGALVSGTGRRVTVNFGGGNNDTTVSGGVGMSSGLVTWGDTFSEVTSVVFTQEGPGVSEVTIYARK